MFASSELDRPSAAAPVAEVQDVQSDVRARNTMLFRGFPFRSEGFQRVEAAPTFQTPAKHPRAWNHLGGSAKPFQNLHEH